MKKFICLLMLVPSLVFSSEGLDTILRPNGNKEAAIKFQNYVSSTKGCQAVNGGLKVIITGFGLWSSGAISYSGFVAENLANKDFWPINSTYPSPSKNYKVAKGILNKDESARIYNRAFTLKDGREISACIILVDVQWDIAGAIIVNEMNRFQPDTVIMSGVSDGGAAVEAGALNSTSPLAGYNPNGRMNSENMPLSESILSEFAPNEEVPMTWDNAYLAKLIAPFYGNKEFLLVPENARVSNTYICNNVSYIALKAAENNQINLAGGLIQLNPKIMSLPQVGFFHYMNRTSEDLNMLKKYSQVMMTLVEGTLTNK